MAEGRLRLVGVPPSGTGLRRALARYVKDGTVVTSLDDSRLQALRRMGPPDVEAEFAPIGDLVGRFLTMLGEPISRLCPRGQLQATVELVCRDLPSDSPLAASSRFRGTAELIAERLGELRDWRVSSDDLRLASGDAHPVMAGKFESLADVDDAVRRVLEETNRQYAADRVARCLDIPADRQVPIKRLVAAVGGAEKPLYEDWLKWLCGFGTEVVVLLDALRDAPHLFGVSLRSSERFGVTIKPANDRSWSAALFTSSQAVGAPDIEVLDCADPLSESEWVVRGCLTALGEGMMPHRVGIFARDAELYAPLLFSAGERLGVPLSTNLAAPLLTNGFASLVLRSLRALAGNDVRALSRIGHSSYLRSGPSRDQALIAACRAAFVQGDGQWRALADWCASQGPEAEWLRQMLSWREQAVASRAPLSHWLHRLRELVGATQMIESSVLADARTRTRDLRAQTVLQRAISDRAYVYDRSGRPELGLAGFVQLAGEVWDAETLVIEGRPNGVAVVSNTAALTEYDALFVVGMLEGTLPRRRSEDPILFDDDRGELARLLGRQTALPNSHWKAAAERDEFVRICCAAAKRLVFSYPQTDESRDNVPAFYLEEVKRACPNVRERHRPRSQFVPTADDASAAPDVALRRALDGPRAPLDVPMLTTEAASATVRPDLESGVSPEELSRALMCAFQSSARHRLRIVAPARRRLMRSLRDLPAQADLVASTTPEEARESFSRAINAYLEEVYPEFEPWELSMLGAAARRLADEWVDREFRSRELWGEPGEKTWPNVRMDEHGLKNELKVGGKPVRLLGRASSLTERQEYSVLRFFDSRAPRLMDKGEREEEDEDAFLYGLYLMSQLHLPQRNPTVEIDGMDGKRVLAGFRDIRQRLSHDPGAGIEVVCVSESRDVYFQKVMNRLREAVAVLERADMKATPGRHCEPCPYGELCRVSSLFGESDDPFEEAD